MVMIMIGFRQMIKLTFALILVLFLTSCGDTGCTLEIYEQTYKGQRQRCTKSQCPGWPIERQCSDIW
jgi:uncharacterized lipoprotein YehR (DUF1307 family)